MMRKLKETEVGVKLDDLMNRVVLMSERPGITVELLEKLENAASRIVAIAEKCVVKEDTQ